MIPVIIALGMIAYGMSEDKSKKSVKKMAKGGGLSTEEQNRFDELDEKMNAYFEGKAQVSSKEMSEHAKLKMKRNLAKYPLLRKQVDWESKVERNSESKMAKGGKVDNLFIVDIYGLSFNDGLLGRHKFRAKNIFEAKKMLANEVGDDLKDKYGEHLDFELKEAPSWMAKGGLLDTKIDALYEKSGFINDDYNWKSKLLEMLQDNSVEAYQIYQKLTAKEKKDVLQELFEMENDMGADGDEDIETSKENLKMFLTDSKNGKKY
jgi:hypothetical protein